MNKTYRIVWNKARNCLMVVGENAKSQGKGAGNKKPLVNAVTAALLALGGSNAVAADILITTPTKTAQTLGSGQSILVDGSGTNTGSIITASNTAISVPIGTSAGAITNSGTITGNYRGIVANQSAFTGGITNSGLISGTSDAGIWLTDSSTLTGAINNSGTISGGINGIVANRSTLTGGIDNSGTISGNYLGIVASNSTLTGSITNSGTIKSDYYGIVASNSTLKGGITNSGSISGGGYYGIAAVGSTLKGGITNSGSISGGGYYGIAAVGSTLEGGIINSGSISGVKEGIGVYASSLSDGITNSVTGTISGGAEGLAIESGSTLSGGINNVGSIFATASTGKALLLSQSSLSGGINNSGTISGVKEGIGVYASSLSDGITNTGTISGGAEGLAIESGSTLSGGINNSGSIIATATSGNAIVLSTSSELNGGINNSGLISSGLYGIYAVLSTLTGGITNSGLISGGSVGIAAVQSTLTGGINNSGLISGNGAGIGAVGSTLTGGINNSGTISGGRYGIHAINSTLTGGITNSGLISGNGAGIGAVGSTLEGGITHSGLISGTSVAGILLTGSSLDGGINNTGSISGGIDGIGLRSSTLTGGITNAGLIQGTEYAIYAGQSSSVSGGILVTGTSAQFKGDIYAPNVDLTLASGAEFTNSNAMSLSGVIVSNGATFNLANAASASSSLSGNINVGNGTGYFTNQGTVDVGSRGASATPTITGNYTQDAGGAFKTTVVSDTEYGQMRVTGSATLAGAAEVTASDVSSLVGSTLAGVITADGGVTGVFSSINTNSSIYTFAGVYTATAFGLVIVAQPNAVANNNAQYGTPAAAGAAGALDQIATDPGAMAPVINALDGTSGQTQADEMAQTLPVVVGASSMVTAQNQIAFNRVVQSRQAQNAGLGLSSGEAFAGNRDVWAKGFGNWANQGNLNNVAGYSVDGGGVAFGFDKQLSLKSNFGISLAYAYSSVSSNSAVAPSSVDINSYQLGLYGDYQLQPDLQLTYQLDGAINTNASTRSLSSFAGTTGVGANATGTYNSYVVHAGLGLKKFFSLNPSTRLTPEVRVDYTTVQTDAYTESGGGLLNLKVNSQSYETLYTSASLRLDHTLSNGLDISANIGVAYNALDNNAQLTSAYQGGGPAFVTNGLEISPWLYNAGVGIGGMVSKDVELNVRYDIDFSSTSYTNQMVSARVKVLF